MCTQLGAFVNETFQAREGFPPELFPEHVPVYMGHYHKPHRVQGTSIEYIGSPYQGMLSLCCARQVGSAITRRLRAVQGLAFCKIPHMLKLAS